MFYSLLPYRISFRCLSILYYCMIFILTHRNRTSELENRHSMSVFITDQNCTSYPLQVSIFIVYCIFLCYFKFVFWRHGLSQQDDLYFAVKRSVRWAVGVVYSLKTSACLNSRRTYPVELGLDEWNTHFIGWAHLLLAETYVNGWFKGQGRKRAIKRGLFSSQKISLNKGWHTM